MRRGERGATLIELVVAIAIMALVSGAATAATFQVFRCTEGNSNRMTAVRQVQNAGYWVSRDVQMAQSITTDNLTPPNLLVLGWVDDSGNTYQVIYTLEDMVGSEFKKLERNQSINSAANITTLVAQCIDYGKTSGEFNNNTLILTVTATVGNGLRVEAETRVYRASPRVG